MVSETKCHLSTKIERPTYLSTLTSAQRITMSIFLNIMVVMQKLRFMQDFTFVINVEDLHSSLHAKRLTHNCARAKHAKNVFVA